MVNNLDHHVLLDAIPAALKPSPALTRLGLSTNYEYKRKHTSTRAETRNPKC
jgi:hypothetical protein